MTRKANNFPKISIVIPSYNKVAYIRDTLQSIISQEYSNLEVIIQDGGSTDGTVSVIKEFAKKYPRVIKWVSKKDGGQVDAINTGLRKASGEVLAYINADDVYSKGALLKVGELFSKHPGTLWATGFGNIINKEGEVITSWVAKYKDLLLRVNSFQLLLMVNFITQPSTFLSKEAYLEHGQFTGTEKYVMEYDLWLKLGKVKMPTVIKSVLSSFRLAVDNISTISSSELLDVDYRIACKYTGNPAILCFHKMHNLGRVALLPLLKI